MNGPGLTLTLCPAWCQRTSVTELVPETESDINRSVQADWALVRTLLQRPTTRLLDMSTGFHLTAEMGRLTPTSRNTHTCLQAEAQDSPCHSSNCPSPMWTMRDMVHAIAGRTSPTTPLQQESCSNPLAHAFPKDSNKERHAQVPTEQKAGQGCFTWPGLWV